MDKEIKETDTSEEKAKKVIDVVEDVFKINQTIFGELFEKANSLAYYANTIVPGLFTSVRQAYEANGLKYTPEIELEIKDGFSSFLKQLTDVLNVIPETEVAAKISKLVFESVEAIKGWGTTLYAAKGGFNQNIKVISDLGDSLSQIPKDFIDDFNSKVAEEENKEIELDNAQKQIDIDNKALENSHIDEYKKDLNNWKEIFDPYSDFLDIETNESLSSGSINYDKNLNKAKTVYFDSVLRSHFTYSLILNGIKDGDDVIDQEDMNDNFEQETKLNNIYNSIISFFGGNQ